MTDGDASPRIEIAHPSGARAQVYLQGAHVARWTDPAGEELLFVSERAKFEPGTAIRGGIPVVFPQFADQGPLPKHGFARTAAWERVEAGTAPDGAAFALLRLADDRATREPWPHPFRAVLRVALYAETLEVALRVANTGEGTMAFTCALHTYFRVGDVRRAAVEGLAGVRYLDKVEAGAERTEERETTVFAGETDRVYVDAPDRLWIRDGESGRTVVLEKRGFRDAVVWNPWEELAGRLPDLGDDEYLRMLCVEPANAVEPVHLPPGEEWTGTQRLTVQRV
ncbi:MAG TPA: D-hexose-6-phosphate mutarotase [Longimicrobiaceae bacterium]|nr:D-hexose-6-phosphate mutarotase [Longimicrobiaceae bacterium]